MQEFSDAGLVWLANRALHPFGYALAVAVERQDGEEIDYDNLKVIEGAGLRVVKTTDPLGIVFSEQEEDRSRAKFFRWLATRGEQT